ESVFGLGCDPRIESSVNKILTIKARSIDLGLILLGGNLDHIKDWTIVNKDQIKQINSLTKRPTTYLIPASKQAPKWITGKHSSIAFRKSSTPYINSLTDLLGCPLVSTSANFHGDPTINEYKIVREKMGPMVDYIIDEPCGEYKKPSTIIDLVSGKSIRS
ncbi:MAG: tRNA threonylcarbamoyladenosine biosynthesis protein RimN, partial [Gammaproteobacteria bacterium]|nr:tRNA threonylcarbamoyladenosine biosynthesis protein RimN [Gammaproteobacteria bacterium]